MGPGLQGGVGSAWARRPDHYLLSAGGGRLAGRSERARTAQPEPLRRKVVASGGRRRRIRTVPSADVAAAPSASGRSRSLRTLDSSSALLTIPG